ncbi:hypothetical protein RR46_08085 [Papilio xuthus]|uniref:Uncharacterized protein n=1 Tax=Papilio xuthus TaxID=66420 RepID=A0A194Q9U1_PAPXU|nr:hypothetical protein RR46_08085 [Papilio xuthus]
MAPVSKVLRTCGLLFYLILKVYSEEASVGNPWIVNLEVESKQCLDSICNYLLHVRGVQFLGHYSWRLTPGAASVGSDCGELYPNYEIKHIETSEKDTRLEIVVPNLNGKIYFCLQDPQKKDVHSRWKYIHQGAKLFLDPKNDVVAPKDERNT